MASPEADAPSAPEHQVLPYASNADTPPLSDGEVPDDVEDMDGDDLYTDEPQESSAAGDASEAPDTKVQAETEAEDDASSSDIDDNVNDNNHEAVDADASNTEPTSPPAQLAAQHHTLPSEDAAPTPKETRADTDAGAEHAPKFPAADVPVPSTDGAVDGSANTGPVEGHDLFVEDVGSTATVAAISPVDPKSDADADDDEEEGEAKEDDNEDTGAHKPASASPSLPYIADIAMLDTGEPGEFQPDAPAVSAFSSMLGAASSSPRPGDGDIDVDKIFDAISASPKQKQRQPPTGPSAMSSKPSRPPKPSKPSKPSKPIPTGPAHPHVLPKPPTGPARMNGGATSSIAIHASSPVPNAAHGGAIPRGPAAASRQPNSHRDKASVERAYQAFLVEEKAYTAVGNWETNFPEGSRMFIGNLSQERVSKRDVFEKFHLYGRLAQVAIKSAYGFVQYHTADEARAAIKNLEGVEIRGRKIHLEITKRKGNEQNHDASPDMAKSRSGRGHERHDTSRDQQNGSARRSRDDRRDSSPRRDHGRGDDHYSSRDRGDRNGRDSYSRHSRDRSRSPGRHGHDKSSYRSRRSPSPHGRSRNERSSSIKYEDVKMRSGSSVPDIQFLVNPGLEREFVKWAQAPFQERGLRTDVLFRSPLTPPRDTLIQTHVVEGVIAVVDLNMAAQVAGKIPLQVFDRSAGASSVHFDGYQDLAPSVAADVASRAKAATLAQRHAVQQPYQPPAQYGGYAPSAPAAAPAAPAISASDLAALATQLDATTLAQVVAMLQGAPQQPQQPQQQQQHQPAAPVYGQQQSPPPYGVPQQPPQYPQQQQQQQLDLASVLGLLGGATPANNYGAAHPSAPVAYGQSAGYPGAPATAAPSAYQQAPGQAASDQALQAIMAQFGQFRQ
ncbi:rna-binding protein [Ophiostoma piceae UAMH 11346]|uniref:Rna-binding protein n=1 Tax=Ophiostoma piceae (strain UAMH 11346) TaxID=1262450 RepID=S3BMD2_OPHP1|nr:rna-binding protein [Ophiostoma piceae UAMH 11346]